MRTLLRPTGFVDSPFGHDGKVARLAGGLNWFGLVELIRVEGRKRTSSEIVPVEGIESRFDEAMAADWARLTGLRAPLQLGDRTVRLDQPQVMGILNATPDSFSDGGAYADSVAAGLLAPGTELFDRQRRWSATVRADGSILCGAEAGSIHGVGKALQGAPSCNGWTFWHLEHEGQVRPIDTLRQLYLLAIED